MPTTRPRHFVTETDELAEALQAAAKRWPELSHSKSKLIARLALDGHRAHQQSSVKETERRLEVIARAGTLLSGMNARAELERMRTAEWPQ